MESIWLLSERIYKEKSVQNNIQEIIWKLIYGFSRITDKGKKTLAQTETVNTTAVRILKLYENDILRIAYSYLHNMEDAEDIVQETVIRYWKKAPGNMNAIKERAWLFTVAANLSKNKIRYKKIRKTDELLDTLIQEEREDLSFVWEAVKALPVKYREVIHLFYYEGYAP